MKSLKFKSIMILCFTLCFSLLTGCIGRSPELSEDFDGEEVKQGAEKLISMINNEDSEAILDWSTTQMKEALNDETLKEIYKGIREGGEFENLDEITVVGHQDKESKEEFAVAVVKATYEDKNFTYTITFDKEMKLAGLYYK